MRILLLIVTAVLLSGALLAQTSDTLAALGKQMRMSTKGAAEAQEKGADVKSEAKPAAKRHMMDRFVDEDGDGICDHRASGLGLRRQLGFKGGKGETRKGIEEGPGKKQRRGGTR